MRFRVGEHLSSKCVSVPMYAKLMDIWIKEPPPPLPIVKFPSRVSLCSCTFGAVETRTY